MTTISDIPLGYVYIDFVMGALIDETGWENGDFTFIADEVFRVMGITAEPSSTADIFEYYALLKYKALEQFNRELSTAYDYKADGESFNRSQMFKQVGEMLAKARNEAMPYLPEGQIEQGRMTFPDDPYSIQGQLEHDA